MSIIGIDTSNYTTSVALVDDRGHLIAQERKLLNVPEGERGLQQSAAVFQHLIRLPELLGQLWPAKTSEPIGLIAVSTKPRPQEGSYMPVFRVGEGYAKSLSIALQVPLYNTTHQEGHIMAGIWSARGPHAEEFLALHLSGGTTELLKVQKLPPSRERDLELGSALTIQSKPTFQMELLGGTTDLHAGQFVDRVGVALELGFPAGPKLEQLARQAGELDLAIPSAVKGFAVSFSGPESQAMRLIEQGEEPARIARAVEKCIATSMEKVLRKAVLGTGIKEVLIVGGVAANLYIRQRLKQRLEHPAVMARLYFAEPEYSSDNAVGIALLGMEYTKNCKNV